jgi:uncharacterized protein YrzB (UPF0473 family)
MDEKHITLVDENGNETLCEILFTFDSEDFKKSYVVYYPVGSEDENGEIEIHASSFVPAEDGTDGELQPIETDEEWDMVEEMINTYYDEEEEEGEE